MTDIRPTIIVGTALIVLFIGLVVVLLVLNHNRRIRHRAELAEFKLAHDREVLQAEREAQQQTLQEVGRELHDNIGQLLTVAQMGLYQLTQGPLANERMAEVMHTLDLSVDEVRRMGRALNSDAWAQRSFSEAVSAECERIERAGLARMHLLVEGEPTRLTPDAKTILFRIFQEAVNNALKHADADTIEVSITGVGPFQLTIMDNGKGFHADRAKAGSGQVNIRRRCELIGFAAELSTAPGAGTIWHFTQHTDPHAA